MTTPPVHEQIRAMRGRGVGEAVTSLTRGDVIRVDGVKYAVMGGPFPTASGTAMVPAYSGDNQHEDLYLNGSAIVRKIGKVDLP